MTKEYIVKQQKQEMLKAFEDGFLSTISMTGGLILLIEGIKIYLKVDK